MVILIFLTAFICVFSATLLLANNRHNNKLALSTKQTSSAITLILLVASLFLLRQQYGLSQAIFTWIGILGFAAIPSIMLYPYITKAIDTPTAESSE